MTFEWWAIEKQPFFYKALEIKTSNKILFFYTVSSKF